MLEDIFRTEQGIYQRDSDTGLLIRQVAEGKRQATPKLFFGSFNPNADMEYPMGINSYVPIRQLPIGTRAEIVLLNLARCRASGFSPDFVQGYMPFGIVCNPSDITCVYEGLVVFSEAFSKRLQPGAKDTPRFEISAPILEVYRQLRTEERGYRIGRC